MEDAVSVGLTYIKDHPEVVTLIIVVASIVGLIAAGFTIYFGIKAVGKDLLWLIHQIGKVKQPTWSTIVLAVRCLHARAGNASVTFRKRRQTVNRLWFWYVRRRKMHLKFGGQLKVALLIGESLPNKRAHAALVNAWLKPAMDNYTNNGDNESLTVTPEIFNFLKEARGLRPRNYHIWVSTVAGELVTDPERYAEEGYTVPWNGISDTFLEGVWTANDPNEAIDADTTP